MAPNAPGKPDVWLGAVGRFPRSMRVIAQISAFGCDKYGVPMGDMTYLEKGSGPEFYIAKVHRHYLDRATDGDVNHEDGDMLHLGQAAWNSLAALEKFLAAREPEKAPPQEPYPGYARDVAEATEAVEKGNKALYVKGV